MQRLFLDLDGVMADFDRHFRDCFGKDPTSKGGVDDAELWALVHGHGNFFRTMPIMEGAMVFYAELLMNGFKPIILTAASKQHYAEMAVQKMDWVRATMGKDPLVLPVYGSSSKSLFVQNKGDILIDDYLKNCYRWEKAGGFAVHHNGNFKDTLNKVLYNRDRNL